MQRFLFARQVRSAPSRRAPAQQDRSGAGATPPKRTATTPTAPRAWWIIAAAQRRCTAGLIAAVVGLAVLAADGIAAITIVNPVGGNHVASAVGGDGDRVDLAPDPVAYLPAGGAAARRLQTQLAAEFAAPNWTFAMGPALGGTLTIDTYKARIFRPHVGGAELTARFMRGPGDAPLSALAWRWVQLIDTNFPIGGAGNPYIDPRPNDDMRPFYWTEGEHADHSFGSNGAGAFDLEFIDFPSRPCRGHPDLINWRADLFLVSYGPGPGGAGNIVQIHDGIRWGWDFRCVPEPGAVLTLLLGIPLSLLRRRG